MRSERMRQRKREEKRLERNEKRRTEVPVSVGDELDILVPRRVATLLTAALRVARIQAGRPSDRTPRH
jgi:hypothetical protein